jgi:hypothetical protein
MALVGLLARILNFLGVNISTCQRVNKVEIPKKMQRWLFLSLEGFYGSLKIKTHSVSITAAFFSPSNLSILCWIATAIFGSALTSLSRM